MFVDTRRTCFSTCRAGSGCSPRSRISPCHAGRGCSPRSGVSACHADRGCSPRSGVSACHAGRGYTSRSCLCASRASTASSPYSAVALRVASLRGAPRRVARRTRSAMSWLFSEVTFSSLPRGNARKRRQAKKNVSVDLAPAATSLSRARVVVVPAAATRVPRWAPRRTPRAARTWRSTSA
jgi:hypothetical protein